MDIINDISYLKDFDNKVLEGFNDFVKNTHNNEFINAVNIIIKAEENGNRLHITGIGKPGHVASYGASLFSSTGTPTYFLHGTEAVHGSCGQLLKGDVVIAISNSGETSELKATVNAIKNNGCKVISITGNRNSWLAKEGDAHIYAGVPFEGDSLNRAPRLSILAEIFVVSRLSLMLQEYKNITPQTYVKWHPGGSLGAIRDNEKNSI